MRKPFTHGEMLAVRAARVVGRRVGEICRLMPTRTRSEVIEAIDADRRHDSTHEALRHVNQVLAHQADGVPLINGKVAWTVENREGAWHRNRYAPMF